MSFKTSCYYAPRSYTRDREFGYGQILYHLYLSLSLYCYCIVFKAWFCRSLKLPCKIWTKQTNKSKGYKKKPKNALRACFNYGTLVVFNFHQILTVIGGRPGSTEGVRYHCLPMQNLDEYILHSSSRVFYSFTPVGRARNRRAVCEGDLCWAPQIYVVRFNRHVMDIWMTF